MAVFDVALVLISSSFAVICAIWILTPAKDTPSKPLSSSSANFYALFTADTLDHGCVPDEFMPNDTVARDDSLVWADIRSALAERYVDVPQSLTSVPNGITRLSSTAVHDNGQLILEKSDATTRVIFQPHCTHHMDPQDARLLSLSSSTAVSPSWIQDRNGTILWSNQAYETLLDRIPQDKRINPRGIFHISEMDNGTTRRRREGIDAGKAAGVLWFDVTAKRVRSWTVCHATDIAQVVKAEAAQRNFVQTLAKTFAHLPTGLAVFDRDRKLALFNPALVDLIALPPEFLSKQPDMFSFFDRLRENRHMPEPKDYQKWRASIAMLSEESEAALYDDTWSLETGQTLHVTGRPHPDKAVAFLFEDISSEITLTRHFRAEVETAHHALDEIPDGLILFTQDGTCSFCNIAFREMWSFDASTRFSEFSLPDMMEKWQEKCVEDASFQAFKTHLLNSQSRQPFTTSLSLRASGARRQAHVKPMPMGGVMVQFEQRVKSAQKADVLSKDPVGI